MRLLSRATLPICARYAQSLSRRRPLTARCRPLAAEIPDGTGIAALPLERDDPREIEGRQALFVVNLQPRTMRGVVSEGMLFDIGYADGVRPVLAVPESAVPDGVRAG